MDINKLSLEEKIGQRFIFGINDDNVDCIVELIKDAYIGGVVLYKKNYDSYEEMLKVIKKLKNANKNNKIPLFIAIDQEGGVVNRMPNDIHNLKSIYDVSMLDNKKIGRYANVISKMLSESGVNMNFAPVADIYNNSISKALYKRCFYGTEKQVSKNVLEYIDKAKENNVISVIKHFPGHGASKMDSHFIIPYVFNYKKVLNKHIIPFNMAINEDVSAIMVGHIIIRKLTGFWPASLSRKIINNCLRKEGYNGLIISDEVNMLKHNLLYHFNYVNKSLISLNDILLVKIKNVSDGYNYIEKYRKKLENEKYLSELDSFVERIINIKEKYNVNDNTKDLGIDIDKINEEIYSINSGI